MNRIRTQVTPPRSDPEASMARQFTLPTPGASPSGARHGSPPWIPDTEVDALVGRTGGTSPTGGPGRVGHRGVGQLVGAAHREPPVQRRPRPWTGIRTPRGPPGSAPRPAAGWSTSSADPMTFDHLDLQVVADGRHSLPTAITVSTPSGESGR